MPTNVAESISAQSKADFISKLSISLKEARESKYWLELLYETEYLTEKEYKSLKSDVEEIGKILTATVKTVKSREN